uniref:Disease resistance N-terminal domain-containing protein n=1 Tax=Oryza meridionalis TaxID=40149 RepID=A0A0E0F3E5_9ORYZ
MVDPLEVLCSVVIGETIQQIVSFIQNHRSQKHVDEETHRLRQLLVEIHTALEAAKGCAITNSWLLCWLRKLEDAACRGDQTLRNWRDMSNKVSSIIDSSNTFKRIKIAAAQLIPSKGSTMKVSATVKKLEAVASGIPKFIQFLSLQNDQASYIIDRLSSLFQSMTGVDERKQAIEFLLHIDNNGSSPPDGCVLPIWGVKGVDGRPLADWWIATRRRFQNTYRTDFDSLFMLIYWLIWKERNTRIFQHIAKSVDRLADDINEEIAIWRAAGIFSQASE